MEEAREDSAYVRGRESGGSQTKWDARLQKKTREPAVGAKAATTTQQTCTVISSILFNNKHQQPPVYYSQYTNKYYKVVERNSIQRRRIDVSRYADAILLLGRLRGRRGERETPEFI